MGAHAPTEGRRLPLRSTAPAIAWGLALFASVVSVVLRQAVPFTVGGGAGRDKLYLRTSTSRAEGAWLGPFDQYTLVKGPYYAHFIAAVYRAGIPLRKCQQLTDL